MPSVCDVGCGQGEFVEELRNQGIDATGFDPVLRTPSKYLHQEFWTPENLNGDADLLVMRCVLPHIPSPWDWLESAATRPRHVLIEYQRIEWLAEQCVWNGCNHNHVNYFRLQDFAARHQVVDAGRFAAGEWEWVLIQIGSPITTSGREPDLGTRSLRAVSKLAESRLATVNSLQRANRSIVLWGAAGKGVVAADALHCSDVPVVAVVDVDRNKWGKFLEASAVEVAAPNRLLGREFLDALVLVSNPRHVIDVRTLLARSDAGRVVSLSRGNPHGLGEK